MMYYINGLQYSAPILIAGYFYGSRLLSTINLDKVSPRHHSTNRRRTAACLLSLMISSFVLESCFQAYKLGKRSTVPPQAVVCSVVSIFTYAALLKACLTTENIAWKHHLGATALATAIETITVSKRWISGTFEMADVISHLRIVLLLAIYHVLSYYQSCPLAQAEATPEKESEKSNLASKVQDDSDDDEFDKELKEKQQKRLHDAGNWLTFLKPYKIFIPLLWPSGNIKLQCCIAFLVLQLIIRRILGFMVPQYMGIITDRLASRAGKDNIPWTEIAIWAGLSICKAELFVPFRDMAFTPVQQFATKSISTTAFRHVMTLSMDFHSDKSSSDLVRIVEQGQHLSDILSFICFELAPLLADATIAVIYIVTAFDPYMALIVAVTVITYGWLGLECTKRTVQVRRRYNNAYTEHTKVQQEALINWQTVTQFNRNKYESDRYEDQLDRYCKAENEMTMAWSGHSTLQNSVFTIGRLAATALAIYRVAEGEIALGQLVMLSAVWSTIMSPITQLTWITRRMRSILTDSERLLVLLQTQPTVVDQASAKPLVMKQGKIELQHVDFAYDPRKPTLSDVNFCAQPGQTIALVGETGGGKSTLMKLLYRYYDVDKGSIRIDGQDIREVTLDSLRDCFGLVPQDPSLFNTTLMENLRYARLDATDDEIMTACRAACIHDKIMQFPDQYKSTVGERGIKLSGGELQRVAIARALLRDPKIVLLDEATSQIDALTEASIQQALKRLTAGRTTFVVAHRLSTIQHADLILVIENGKIIEQGSHEELFSKGGKYLSLWSRQMSKNVSGIADNTPSGASTPPTDTDEWSTDEETA